MSSLTKEQKSCALRLRTVRPTTIPGTCVIVDDQGRHAWYNLVICLMHQYKVKDEHTGQFCDIAGVPS